MKQATRCRRVSSHRLYPLIGFEAQTNKPPEKPSSQFLGLIMMSHWLAEDWIWIWDSLVVLPSYLFCVENCDCLSRGVQVVGVVWWAVTRIMAEVGDLVQRTGDGRIGRVLNARTIGRSGDAVCGLHCAWGDDEREFFSWASKPSSTVCQWFGFKTTGSDFLVETQNQGRRFVSGLVSKPLGRVS
jgi:hypothetical protein